ncbi:MAG: amidohydrolase [Clostridiales bacterium]|nr:amidohydrolase [Clostridiales bacterium]
MIKQKLYDEVQSLSGLCQKICRTLWDNPELSTEEKKSSRYLMGILEKEGFQITQDPHLPYAFCAQVGEGKPVLAILGEYDALPGLSQKVCATKEPVVEDGPGHGCGHNMLGAAAVTAAVAVKRCLEKAEFSGTLRFYGCPEEELLSGKVKMAYYHMFDGCDAAITWHPSSTNMAHNRAYLAIASARFYFKGISSHAAFAPEQGRSALDAVELMNVGSNYLREHVIDKTRIHYSTDSGGFAPNIVPDHAGAWYYVRAPHMSDVKDTMRRINLIARGAAMMTETEVEIVPDCGCYELSENVSFADLAYANLVEADGPKYTEDELKFAKELQATMNESIIDKEKRIHQVYDTAMILGVSPREKWQEAELNASSDTGDVSNIMPTCLFTTACWPIGCAPHTWQATASAGMSIGQKGAQYAAKVCAGIAYDLYTKPELLAKITKEFQERHTEEYVPMYQE